MNEFMFNDAMAETNKTRGVTEFAQEQFIANTEFVQEKGIAIMNY
jgi:hypothetical protein